MFVHGAHMCVMCILVFGVHLRLHKCVNVHVYLQCLCDV